MKKAVDAKSDETVAVLTVTQEEGAYCLTEYALPLSVLEKHAKQVSRMEPDHFAILNVCLTKKAREILGI